MEPLPQFLMDEIERTLAHPGGPAGRLRDMEIEAGFHPVKVGAWFPFHLSEDDWKPESVITQNGKDIRIVLADAICPGYGAFRRLIKAITGAGFVPVVVAPIGMTMPAIMEKWGWECSDGEPEEWRPKASH